MATWASIKNKISHSHENKSERPYEMYKCYFKELCNWLLHNRHICFLYGLKITVNFYNTHLAY